MFDVLFFRHDRAIPGFVRERQSDLDDVAIKKLFEAFCFQVRLEGHSILSADIFRKCLERASKQCGVEIEATAFRHEIVKTACLMQEEGFDVAFIHKSVAEFHAAAFVRSSSDIVAAKFYSNIRTNERWRKWIQELRFLS